MTNRKRIEYLDIAKGIGMILVIMGHIEYINAEIHEYIYAFHMPLFFLISGILIWEKKEEEKHFGELIVKRLKGIMLPYAVFSILFFVIESVRVIIKDLDTWDIVFKQLFQSVCLQGVSTLWFLPALFMSELIFVGIRKKCNNGLTIGIVGVIGISTTFLNVVEKNLYLQYYESVKYIILREIIIMLLRNLFCVGFVCVGYYVGKFLMPKLQRVWLQLGGMIVLAGVCYWSVSNNINVELRYMTLGSEVLYFVGAITGSVAVLFGCRLLEGMPVKLLKFPLEYYGRNSLIIMATHLEFRVLYCSIKLASVLSAVWNNEAIFCIWIVVLVFLLEVPIIWIINHFFPIILGKKN